jgi:hypothetical protein
VPDLGPAAGAIFDIGAPILGRAFKAFAGSLVASALLAVVVAIGCYLVAARDGVARGLVAAAIAIALFAIAGGMVAVKRAILAALLHGFEKLQLGARTMKLLFDVLLRGDRGVAIQRAVERIPLPEAEARLRAAVDKLISDDAAAGFFRRRIRAAAIEKVALVTLARFRDENASYGAVDLVKVENELASRIDQLVVDAASGAALKVTAAFLGGATAISIVAAFLLRR